MIRALLALLLLFGARDAFAQTSMEQAYTNCSAARDSLLASMQQQYANPGAECRTMREYSGCPNGFSLFWSPSASTASESWSFYQDFCASSACPTGQEFDFGSGQCMLPNNCPTMPQHTDWNGHPDGTAATWTVCHEGCEYSSALQEGAPNGIAYDATGEQCTTGNTPVPDGDSDGDGVPDSTDTDSGGDGGSNGNDGGDNGSPGDPPGTGPGDETDNRAEGGANCVQPPVCSGDGIQCNLLYQTWKARCNLERAVDADGALKVKGTGTGGAIAVAGGGGGDDSNAGMFDDLKNGGPGEPDIDPGSVWGSDESFTPDEAGFGFTRTCPAPPTITLAGMTKTLDTTALCDLAEIIGSLVLLMAAAHAFFALAKS